MAKTKQTEETTASEIDKLLAGIEDESDNLLAFKEPEKGPEKKAATVDGNAFIQGHFFGTYHVPSEKHADKREESKFDVTVKVPRMVLDKKLNFQAYFRRYFADRMRKHDQRFIKFGKIYFVNARNLDGTMINNPRTFSPDELKQYAVRKQWQIDFELFSGWELRDIIFQYFLPDNGQPEVEAFAQYQDKIRRKYGAESLVRNQLLEIPDDEVMTFNK